MKPYCIRCGKDGLIYPVEYTEPNNIKYTAGTCVLDAPTNIIC